MKHLVIKNYHALSTLCGFTTGAGVLLLLRIKFTHSYFFSFLLWNLFLAAIPFGISFIVKERLVKHRVWQSCLLLLWLFFLPNAPYIVTDFIHLSSSSSIHPAIDAIVVGSFALAGLLFYCFSTVYVQQFLWKKVTSRRRALFSVCLALLSSFGVYLGRFERWNSWDLARNPAAIWKDSIQLLFFNDHSWAVWSFTGLFAVFLILCEWAVHRLINTRGL